MKINLGLFAGRIGKKIVMSDGKFVREEFIDDFKAFVRELLDLQKNDPDRFNKIAKGTLEPGTTMAQQEACLRLHMINPT